MPALRNLGLLGPRLQDVAVSARAMPWRIESARQLLANYLAYDRHHQFVSEYLVKVDGATMHYAVEARSPFLDTDLWEYAGSLPSAVRLHDGKLKAILRELARRNISAGVAGGAKRGFSIPVEHWIAGPWRERIRELFDDSLLGTQGWIDQRALNRDMERAVQRGEAPTHLWYFAVLEAWLRRESNADLEQRPASARAVAI
jgi:asparagine synthase (glutamine-hydrolysing)